MTKAVFAGELRKTVKSFILLTFFFIYFLNINDFAVKIILSLNEVKEESKIVAILFVYVFVYLLIKYSYKYTLILSSIMFKRVKNLKDVR